MKEKKKSAADRQAVWPGLNPADEMTDVASVCECTGLIPTPPESEAEAEAYTDLGTVPKPAP